MLTTKRYDYVPFERVLEHPLIANHRALNLEKVRHYEEDILRNGLLEPLVVWERKHQEYFLVGGFHRLNAIKRIRQKNPGYYDRIDVRVVSGDLEEIRALNLKLNADRLDAKITDYFDTILYLNNANWPKERIAGFLDKSVSWVEEILRFVPSMDPRVRALLHEGRISWSKAKQICRKALDAEPGQERNVVDAALHELESPQSKEGQSKERPFVLTPKVAHRRFARQLEKAPDETYTVSGRDLLSLLTLLAGKADADAEQHLERVREIFPSLVD
jgi:ParB family transcriptional regulator, chromosome partitioning protein